MQLLSVVLQIWIALSILFVWVYHFPVVVLEFQEYGLPDWVRASVGAAKIILSTLLVAGIWYPRLVLIPALLMALLMVGAQWFHFRVRHPWQKYPASLILLVMSLVVAGVHAKVFAQ